MRKLLVAAGALAAAGIVVAVVLLAASGGNSLAQAAEGMEGQNFRLEMKLGFVEEGAQIDMIATGVQAADNSRARLDAKTTIEGLEYPLDQTMIGIGDELWVRTKQFTDLMPDGKFWVHTSDPSVGLKAMPMAEYTKFLAESDEVENKGQTTIRGRRVTHYAGRINAREVAEKTGGNTEEFYEERLGDRDVLVPIEVWVDDDDRVARLVMNTKSQTMTVEILEYGVPVDVKAPAANDTVSQAEFDRLTAE